MNKNIIIFTIFFLIFQTNAGPMAPGAWTAIAIACAAQCAPLVPPSPPYLACVSTCWGAKGPIASFLLCFSEDTTIITPTGSKVISQISIGESVLTTNDKNQNQWTTVVFHQKEEATNFIRIETVSQMLEVTPQHVMIVGNKLLKAKQLSIGMAIKNKIIQKLSMISKNQKISLSTKSGTILANGILTTTICGDYIDVHGNDLDVLEKWKADHAFLLK